MLSQSVSESVESRTPVGQAVLSQSVSESAESRTPVGQAVLSQGKISPAPRTDSSSSRSSSSRSTNDAQLDPHQSVKTKLSKALSPHPTLRPLLYVNYHHEWFQDPKNWNDAEKLFV